MAAGIELGIALLALAAMLFAYAALKGYQFSFKPILIQLGHIFNAIKLPGRFPFVGGSHLLGGLGDWFIALAEEIERILAGFYLTSEGAASYLFDQLAKQARWLGQELSALADTVDGKWRWWLAAVPPLAALWAAVHAFRSLPKAVRAITHPDLSQLRAEIRAAEAEAVSVEADLERLARGIDRTAKQLGGRITKTGASFGAAVGGLAGRVAVLWPTLARLRKLVLTRTGAAAFVAAALGTLGLGWLRCRGVKRVGRSLCGASGLIEALYAGTLAAFAVTDLCRFAYGIERAAELFRPIMLEWVDVEHALLHCPTASYPSDFPLAAFSPTPVYDAVAL